MARAPKNSLHARALGIDIEMWITEVHIDVQLPLAA